MPLQKSFSDQNHSSKSKNPRQQWARNNTYGGHPSANSNSNIPLKPLQEKPPIPVSTTTRNKLSSFQFHGTDTNAKATRKSNMIILSSDDDEKENSVDLPRKKRIPKKASKAPRPPEEQLVLPQLKENNVPTTPAGRLALLDLIGMGDARGSKQETSPEERIEWDHNKDMIHSSASSFSGVRRARKRARSSSPAASSPVAQASRQVRRRKEQLDTSVDPGSDLWGRLSHSNAPTPQGEPNSVIANLMYTSSPQPQKEGTTPRSVAGFRRANSCGNQFPKRRRVGTHSDGDVFTESVSNGPSKLSCLIEKVQEGLTQPMQPTTPAVSSKLSTPLKGACEDIGEESQSQEDETTETTTLLPFSRLSQHSPRELTLPATSNSSDYGDDDIDESLLEAFDDPQSCSILDPIPRESVSIARPYQASQRSSTFEPQPIFVKPQSPVSNTMMKGEDDEFGDSDVEMFAADMEMLVSKFDKPAGPQADHLPYNSNAAEASRPARPRSLQIPDSEASDDEFGSDGLDECDLVAAEVTATQSIQQSANGLLPSTPKTHAIQRYLVTNILDSTYKNAKGRDTKEKILLLQVDQKKSTRVVHLRGAWMETPVNSKAYVHVIGTFDVHGRCVIDDDNNILILHPDHLISSTVVGDSFGCTRRAVLQDRVKATSEPNAPMLYGTILHEIFQAALLANRWDIEWLTKIIQTITTNHLEDLYTIHLQIPDAVEYLLSKMSELQAWAELFVASQPKPGALVQAGNGEKSSMCVSKLLDVEEHVWSPMYGLKGNIDATVQVTMKDGPKMRTLTVPFEVKTGKNPTPAHRAQTALYNLLLSDRYDIEIAYGILYYMETSETIRIPSIRRELLHMIMQRNELACFVRERHAQLPPMLKKENMCNRCYAKVPCFIYHKLADDGNGETSGLKTKFDEVVKHLTPKHQEFFLKWDDLLTKEEKDSLKHRRELWTMLSSEREKLGRCFSHVIIEPGSAHENESNSKINRYTYNMVKQDPSPDFSFLDSQIVVGEPIVISDEQGHYALANGYVTHVRKSRISVAVDRRLHNARIRQPGFDDFDNQVFTSIMEVASEGVAPAEAEGKLVAEPVKYRLDKDEFSNGMATVRNNLIQVMAEGPFGSREIRGLVVDLNAPRFKTSSTAYVLRDRNTINVDQRRAINKVMSAQDYALILGMPGTGKTTTIAHIIRALVAQGKSVLLTSYTHTAVDNILLKLKDDGIPILRLGATAKIHPEIQGFAQLAATPRHSFDEIKSAWHDTPIVGTTCLGINHPIFNERVFDYCIVDEASQITLPVCIGPIRLARTFILVGDHYQLPPLVQNEEARTGGLDISLFKHLSDSHPDSVVYLEHQYRMCEDVMALSNNLIYNGRLKCGSIEVASRSITIPDIDALRLHHFSTSTMSRSQKSICFGPVPGRCWIRTLIESSRKVAFINTDPLLPLSREEAKGNRIVNPTEATICQQLVDSLLTAGVPASDIGVMTHYRSQLSLLKYRLRSHPAVEMHTADRFQGRDKEVIILSLVRSNQSQSIGELLKDWRRINVAFTRAKTKLLVIGSRETLKGNGLNAVTGEEEMVAKFVKLMEEKSWVFDLPKTALEDHLWEDGATQHLTGSTAKPAAATQKQEKELHGLGNTGGVNVLDQEREKENIPVGGSGIGLKRGPLGVVKRQPGKKVFGNKPFKIPQMSVLKDVLNEYLY